MSSDSTIICGDNREVMRGMAENSVNCIITSPPYNVGIKYSDWDDKLSADAYWSFITEALQECYRVLKPDGRIAINVPYEVSAKGREGRIFIAAELWARMKSCGFRWAGIVHLKENNAHRVKLTAWGSWLSASAPYIYNMNECVLIAYKERWRRDDKSADKLSKEDFRELVFGEWAYRAETKKWTAANYSLDIPVKALKILSYSGDVVMDIFCGSGTTGVACKQLGRRFLGIDISESYCAVARERIAGIAVTRRKRRKA